MAKPAKKPTAPKVGRPKTDTVWKDISVRFTEWEKVALETTSDSVGLSQAEFIRQATLRQIASVKESGKLEIRASGSV